MKALNTKRMMKTEIRVRQMPKPPSATLAENVTAWRIYNYLLLESDLAIQPGDFPIKFNQGI